MNRVGLTLVPFVNAIGYFSPFCSAEEPEQSYYAGAVFLLLLLQLTEPLLSLHTQPVLGTNCHRNVTEPKLQRDCASNPPSPLKKIHC